MKGLQNIRERIKRVSFYIPFSLYFLLFLSAAILGYNWLNHKAQIADSSYKDIFTLLLSVTLWVSVTLLMFCFFSVLLPFIFFWWQKRKRNIEFNLTIAEPDETRLSTQLVNVQLQPVLKPVLGFLKIRINYDITHFSSKFYLQQPARTSLFQNRLEGSYLWDLPEIREYRLEKAIIYFEDCFHFFSFALAIHTSASFHTYPGVMRFRNLKAMPRKTEETEVRIEELKKVEGELINYKNFEANDDVRRIVWKIYAKNKELVVRIPEIIDPYASHIYFYASFFSDLEQDNEIIRTPFLNFYKTIAWSVYKQLLQKDLEVRFIPDQPIPPQTTGSESERVKYSISVSKWHHSGDLRNYVRPGEASVVLISSLSDKEQVKELIDRYGTEIAFVFVPLSECLRQNFFGHWLKWIFVQEEKDQLAVYRTIWTLSPLRSKIEENEEDLKKIIKDYERSIVLDQRTLHE